MNEPNLATVWLAILTTDFLRYAVTAAAVYLLSWKLFGLALQPRRILEGTPRPGQIRREISYSLVTVLIFATNGFGIYLLQRAGYTQIYTDFALYGGLYWAMSLVLAIVLHDAYFYWTHRLLHRTWWFRHVHRVHHQSTSPTPWAAYAFHPLEGAIHAAFFVLLVVSLPLHPTALFAFLLHMIVRNCIGHSAVELFPWRLATRGWLRWCATVTHHHFHHARNRGNFGLYFSWWDRVCGTEDAAHRTYGEKRFGSAAAQEPT